MSPFDELPTRLDYPVAYEVDGTVREVVLRLWSRRPHAGLNSALERVAVRVGPALEEWFRNNPVIVASAIETGAWVREQTLRRKILATLCTWSALAA